MLNALLEQLLQNTGAQDTTGIARFPQVQWQRRHLFGGILDWLLNALRQRGAFGSNLLNMATNPGTSELSPGMAAPAPSPLNSELNPGMAAPMPSPLNSALVTSPTRPSTVSDTLAPNSGDASFQPTSLPTSPLLDAPNKLQSFANAKAMMTNPLLHTLARRKK